MSSAKTCIYKVWKDSVPVVPFPFQFTDKTEGKIVQTWSDVKDGLNRDAINSALAFATGHFTPTSPQSAIMRETMEKEEKRRRKTLLGQTASSRPTTNETATDRLGTASTNYSRPTGAASVPLSTTTAAGTNASDAASANRERRRSKVRGAPPTEEEKALLLQSEGGVLVGDCVRGARGAWDRGRPVDSVNRTLMIPRKGRHFPPPSPLH